MTFSTFLIIVFSSIITGFVWHWLIRSAVAGGIIDARKKIAKERSEHKALQIVADRKRRPSRGIDNNFQSSNKNSQVSSI